MKQARLAPFFGDGFFYRAALAVMIPVMLQQFVSTASSFIDSVMLAGIDEFAMSAVAVAGKPTMFFNALILGFTSAASLLISQYHGAGNFPVCQRIFSVQILLGFVLALPFAALLFLFPAPFMRLFVQDAYTVETGVLYLRIAVFAYLPMSFSLVCLFSLRSIGVTLLPMLVSFLTIGLNVLLEWLLIFGMMGLPRLGVGGAALGLLLSRTFEMSVYALVLLYKKTEFHLRIAPAFRLGRQILLDFIRKGLPLIVNEVLWSIGQIVIFWSYARVGEALLPSINITDQVMAVSIVPIHAVSAAIAIFVGRELGANRFREARQGAKRLYGLNVMLSVVSAGIALLLACAVPAMFPLLPAEHLELTKRLVRLVLFFFPFTSLFMVSYLLLRAGGDTKHMVLLDSVFLWLMPVPAALVIGLLLPDRIGLFDTVLIIQALQCLRTFVALWIVERGTWLQNLTRGNEQAECI